MTELPAPLVPSEVDLRDFDYIPLYGDRLFNSDTWALCDPDEKVAALRLWWRAWHEEPAGSLPNNDRLLAERAGYGVAVKAFLAVKNNAMRGWMECSDGRLYHPVVASIALDVWKTKRRKATGNEAERERKKLKRAGLSAGQTLDVRRTNGQCPPDNDEYITIIPPDTPPKNSVCPPENALKGKEKEDTPPAPPPGGGLLEFEFGEFWKVYPRRDDRGHALKAFKSARKKAETADIVVGAKRYAKSREGQDPQFTALAATWLTGERWADESAVVPRRSGVTPMHPGAGG